MFFFDKAWLKRSLKTRQGIAGALTAFVPLALVLGRAPADIIVSIVAILFLGDCIIRRNWGWIKTPWIAVLLVLWAYTFIRACFVPYIPGDSDGKHIFAAFAWLRYIFFAASAATWALEDEKWRIWLLRAIIAGVLFMSVDAIIQYFTGSDIFGQPRLDNGRRLSANFNRPIVGMSIANIFAPALFWLIDRKRPIASVIFGSVAFAAVLLSGERMALLFGMCIMLVWIFALLRAYRKFWPILIVGLCACVILFGLRPDLFERQVTSTVTTIQNVVASPYGQAWSSGLHVGEAHPLFGVGMQRFRDVCPDARFGPLEDPVTGIPRCYVHPHNAYIEWFSEQGVIGLAGFITFIVIIFASLRRHIRVHPQSMLLWGLGVTIVVRLLPFFTSTSFFNNWSAIPFWLCVGWAMREGESTRRKQVSMT